MPSLTLPGRLIWFAHVPKAGGTSVEQIMVGHWEDAVGHLHWGWDLWWKRGGWRRADPPCSPQHLVWADARGVLPREPDAVFAVVRDPLARVVSEYRYQRHARRGTVLGRALAHLPFSLWLGIVLGIAARNPYAFDNHLRPQGDFVPEGAAVFRLEDGLEPALDWLAEVAGARRAEVVPRGPVPRPGRGRPRHCARIRQPMPSGRGWPSPCAPHPVLGRLGAIGPGALCRCRGRSCGRLMRRTPWPAKRRYSGRCRGTWVREAVSPRLLFPCAHI